MDGNLESKIPYLGSGMSLSCDMFTSHGTSFAFRNITAIDRLLVQLIACVDVRERLWGLSASAERQLG